MCVETFPGSIYYYARISRYSDTPAGRAREKTDELNIADSVSDKKQISQAEKPNALWFENEWSISLEKGHPRLMTQPLADHA